MSEAGNSELDTGRLMDLEVRLAEAEAMICDLRAENERLRGLTVSLGPHPQVVVPASEAEGPGDAAPPSESGFTPEAKIALFRSLFRGREDVYALRWEGREGRAGYSPARRPGARWERGQRPDAKDLLPLEDEVIRKHLMGGCTVGVYPLLHDETCWFLALDFDKTTWQEDMEEVLRACDLLSVPAALERSRSGRGGHLWVFFKTPVPASAARNLGCALLTQALERRHQIGFGSYDRLFPSQDTMPKGGFGNLIALPLQGVARRNDNTVFLDRDFQSLADQWGNLVRMPRLGASEVDRIVREAARKGKVMGVDDTWMRAEGDEEQPWNLTPSRRQRGTPIGGPLPANVVLVIANRVFIDKAELPPALISRLRQLAAFQNPEFYKA